MHPQSRRSAIVRLVILSVFLFCFAGCNALRNSALSGSSKDAGPVDIHYDFGDVLVPHDLLINKKESFIYQTSGFSAGVLVLRSRTEADELLRFFRENMEKDNWALEGLIKTPHSLLFFKKQNRWCVINISRGPLYSDVRIWVLPTGMQPGSTDTGDTDLLK